MNALQSDSLAARLRKARQDKGYATARAAAAAFGWPGDTYTQHENGLREPRRETAERYARAFGVALAWLLTGESRERAHRGTVRLAGIIGAGQMVFPDPEFSGQINLSLDGDAAEAFEVKGDSMLPVAREGDLLFFGRPRTPRNLIGRECVVELTTGERYFKTLAHGSQPGLFTLISYNATPIEDVEIVKAGELLAIRRR